ncbi:uncharacterized protein B0H18DRAFT_1211974 [Fomitopsis serialis]|uniref:uncharacterized protein n=1 Tax=Fomitopsis serialis TaxID=139415 RepID=UPI002007550E|nr:uncharacterized protein B0H18DRAFT_1211974 [Neoantrodia serialis]KAH9924226.1 hypothetical protein B0H18DRAFT_1211974 [Neoantrodia serialis]
MNYSMNWCYDYRACYFSDDEDLSDSDIRQESDRSLLSELDLSSRLDAAQHRTNPWTIAKINASTRNVRVANVAHPQAIRAKHTPNQAGVSRPEQSKSRNCGLQSIQISEGEGKSSSDSGRNELALAGNSDERPVPTFNAKSSWLAISSQGIKAAHTQHQPPFAPVKTRQRDIPEDGDCRNITPSASSKPMHRGMLADAKSPTHSYVLSGVQGCVQEALAVQPGKEQVSPGPQSHPPVLPPPSLPSNPETATFARTRIQPNKTSPGLRQSTKRDAYSAFPISPDATWCTLPSTQPKRTSQTFKARTATSKRFTLPLLTADGGRSQSTGRKRTVYCPPPRATTKSHAHGAPSRGQDVGGVPSRSTISNLDASDDGERRRFNPVVTVYIPLSPVSSPPKLDDPASLRARASLPSPPPSDPILETDADDRGTGGPRIRHEPYKIRYAGMKRRIAERRRASTQLWDRLGLPSCGVVFQDPPSSPASSQTNVSRRDSKPEQKVLELPICVWNPADSTSA